MRKILVLFVLCTMLSHISAQKYVPIDTANISERVKKAEDYVAFSKSFVKEFKKTYSGKGRSYILKQLENRSDDFKKELEGGTYLFDKRFDALVDSLIDVLRKNNAIIPPDLKFYISRNISLNAASFGDKVFVINLGSFYFLDNDNELAAMLAHEIGHLLLDHEIKVLQTHYQVEKVDSKSTISEVKSDKYNRGTRALEKFKSIMYADQSLNRTQEHEADSLGYLLYKNAGFKAYDYINSYRLMALYDSITPVGVKTETYRKIFDFENLHFKESWLKREDFSAYDYSKYKSKFDEDSLKSHPATEARIKRLQGLFPELKDSVAPSAPSLNFEKLQTIADYERIPGLVINEDFGLGVYLCLLKLQQNDRDQYYSDYMGELFAKIYEARKVYKLNRYLDSIDPKSQSDSYQQFLSFMWNLSTNDLKLISTHYNKKGS